jgi:hypothetical protein
LTLSQRSITGQCDSGAGSQLHNVLCHFLLRVGLASHCRSAPSAMGHVPRQQHWRLPGLLLIGLAFASGRCQQLQAHQCLQSRLDILHRLIKRLCSLPHAVAVAVAQTSDTSSESLQAQPYGSPPGDYEDSFAPPLMPPLPPGSDTTAQMSSFPFCVCTDYRCPVSPYRLKFADRIINPTSITLRFKLLLVRTHGMGSLTLGFVAAS